MVKVKTIENWSAQETANCLYWLTRCNEEGMDLDDVLETTKNFYLKNHPKGVSK